MKRNLKLYMRRVFNMHYELTDVEKSYVSHDDGVTYIFRSESEADKWIAAMALADGLSRFTEPKLLENGFWRVVRTET